MTETTNTYSDCTTDDLAGLVTKLAEHVRSFNAEEREQLLHAVADRLQHGDAQTVDLGNGFTFKQTVTGTLFHEHGPDGVFLRDVSRDEAEQVVEAVVRSWTRLTPAVLSSESKR